ncbi:MAG: septation protein IspZ [Sphingomonadales bacterium]|nr:septation protein IspZ [Sphingomonadales bacterium]
MAGQKAKGSTWINFAVDYGPVLVFFLTYRHFAPANHDKPVAEVFAVVTSTVAFMAAAVVALAVSWWKLKRISAMLGLSTALIVVFGGLTVLLRDSFWIQVKPTVIYLLFGGALLGGWWTGKPLLKILLSAAFEGLDDAGWMILSRNWGWFFLFFAALNEVLRHYYNIGNNGFGTWIALKLWLFMPISLLFTFAHIPMLLRHGLGDEPPVDVGGEAG